MSKAYLFKTIDNGVCLLTHEGKANLYRIDRIIAKRGVKKKGRHVDYEEVVIDGTHCLIKRKDLTFTVMSQFVACTKHESRSVQHRPYTDDLLDESLLNDLGLTVLTFKHYYSANDELCDLYYLARSEDVNDNLIKKLNDISNEAIEHANVHRAHLKKIYNESSIEWKLLHLI